MHLWRIISNIVRQYIRVLLMNYIRACSSANLHGGQAFKIFMPAGTFSNLCPYLTNWLLKGKWFKNLSGVVRSPCKKFWKIVFLKYKRSKKMAWSQSHHLHLQWKFKLLAKSLFEVEKQNIAGPCQQTFEGEGDGIESSHLHKSFVL